LILVPHIIPFAHAKSLYEILGVQKTATDKEIRSAYKKLSLQYHPDKCKDVPKEEAENRFTEIAGAYEILNDPARRREYDEGGDSALKKSDQANAPKPTDPYELFRQFTEGYYRPGGPKKQRKPGPEMPAFLDVELEEMYSGAPITIVLARRITCPKCGGNGAKRGIMSQCPQCHGRGVYVKQSSTPIGIMQNQISCDKCGGTGQIVTKKCGRCRGEGTIISDEKQVVFVDRGAKDGEEMSYQDLGDDTPELAPGRLVLKIQERPHPRFIRKVNDLYTNVSITVREAFLGVLVQIKHLDKRVITIDRRGLCTPHGHDEVRPGEGMPIKGSPQLDARGSLYVEFHVAFPPQLTKEQKLLVDQMFPREQYTSPQAVGPDATTVLVDEL
jgi:DnaJ-related protein SCJ1